MQATLMNQLLLWEAGAQSSWNLWENMENMFQHSYPRSKEAGIFIQQLWSVIGWGPENSCINSQLYWPVLCGGWIYSCNQRYPSGRVPGACSRTILTYVGMVQAEGIWAGHHHWLRITICIANLSKSEDNQYFTLPGYYKDLEHFNSMYSPSPDIYRLLLLCILIPSCLFLTT